MTENDYRRILKDREIKYRATLNLPKDVTFGVEIEYENVETEVITALLNEQEYFNKGFYDWINKEEMDLFVPGDDVTSMNGEINSPVLKDNIRSWKNLRIALNLLNRENAIVTNQCGGHVNIGTQILGFNTICWRNFFLLWMLYEREIYKFSSGEFSKIRTREENVINRMKPILSKNMKQILNTNDENLKTDIFKYLTSIGIKLDDKVFDVSFAKLSSSKFQYDNRIEFRIPNGTLKEEIWQNYINFFAKFLLACKKELDIEKIVYKINNNDHSVLELADLVFEDNIDKDNFLIQTLKTNKVYKKQLPPHIQYY